MRINSTSFVTMSFGIFCFIFLIIKLFIDVTDRKYGYQSGQTNIFKIQYSDEKISIQKNFTIMTEFLFEEPVVLKLFFSKANKFLKVQKNNGQRLLIPS